MQPHRGTTVLVLGILGLVACPICGIIAWVMGNKDLAAMAAGQMDREGEGNTKVGKICGIIATILWILGMIAWVLMMIVSLGAAAATGAASGLGTL
ncbi:MAG: hypothetical protein P1V20_06295 [Verrucomicrobiales bacterium]|nr:hypothetical protein [Verrucomicrobiales bacterium]